MELSSAAVGRLGGVGDGKITPPSLLPAYDSLPQQVVGLPTLSWCSPESTYLVPTSSDGPATGFFPLQSGTASVYPGLGAMLHWPAPGASFSLMGVPSDDPWPAETDSDGCSLFSPVDAPSPRASQQYPAVAEFIAMASTAQAKGSPSPKAEHPSPTTAQDNPSAAKRPSHARKQSGTIQLRTATRKPRKQAGLGPVSTAVTKRRSNGAKKNAAAAKTEKGDDKGEEGDEDEDDDLTPEERRARRAHNRVEKQYRTRLNAQFERLLAVVLPAPAPVPGRRRHSAAATGEAGLGVGGGGTVDDGIVGGVVGLGAVDVGGDDEKRLSKAEVLDLALRRIRALEAERERLDGERGVLVGSMRAVMAAAGVPWFPVAGKGCVEVEGAGVGTDVGGGWGMVGESAGGEGWVGGGVG